VAEPKAVEQPKTKKVVKYTGSANARVITDTQWQGAGVLEQETVTWDLANGHEVPASKLNADALRYCDERDDGFKVVEVPA
jgi:hypothetical protein